MTFFVYKFLVWVSNPIQEIYSGFQVLPEHQFQVLCMDLVCFLRTNDWVDVNPVNLYLMPNLESQQKEVDGSEEGILGRNPEPYEVAFTTT